MRPPCAALHHVAGGGLRGEEGPLEVHVEDEVVVLLADLEERLADLDAGVVDEDVEAPEGGDGGADEALGLRGDADVGAERDGLPAQLLDLRRDGARFVLLAVVVHGHVGALAREAQGDGLADAARAAGDEGGLAFESHRVPPSVSSGARSLVRSLR